MWPKVKVLEAGIFYNFLLQFAFGVAESTAPDNFPRQFLKHLCTAEHKVVHIINKHQLSFFGLKLEIFRELNLAVGVYSSDISLYSFFVSVHQTLVLKNTVNFGVAEAKQCSQGHKANYSGLAATMLKLK